MEKEPKKTEQEIRSEEKHKRVIGQLKNEICKDLPFFGLSGFVVTYLSLVEDFFEQWFPNRDLGSLADGLLLSIISFSNYSLLMFGLMIIGSITNILHCFKKEYVWLNNMIKHVECRFAQIISATISFVLGVTLAALLQIIFINTLIGVLFVALSVAFIIYIFVAKDVENRLIQLMDVAKWYAISVGLIALLHSIFTRTFSEMWFFALSVGFILYIFAFSIVAYTVTRRIEPLKDCQIWDKWWVSALVLAFVIVVIILALIGDKTLMIIFAFILALPVLLALGYKGYCLWRERQQQQV